MIVRYILNSRKIVEPITLEYNNGILSGILLPFKYPLKLEQYDIMIAFVPFFEKNISEVERLGSGLYVTKEIGANIKVAMFCTHYMKAYPELKYTATALDGKRIRPFKIWDELLIHYFNSDNFLFKGKHTIANLTKYYNELVVEFNKNGSGKHPDQWIEAYENKLKSQIELSEYWAHLRSLGFEPKKNQVGKTIDWIKKKQEH